jgi:ankyrin repeat protein
MDMRINATCPVSWGIAALLSGASLAAAGGDLRLVEAVKRQDKAAIQDLLKQRVDVNLSAPDGATALHWAVHRDDTDTVDLLVRAGAHVNAANELGVTPLSLACLNRNAVLVETLLKLGANPNATSASGVSPLMTAARTGNVDIVKALLVKGANVNAKEASRGQTALMWAVSYQHPNVVRALIEVGADVHARTLSYPQWTSFGPERPTTNPIAFGNYQKGGSTPLLLAARVGDLESARLLLAAGAKVNDAAPDGLSAVIVATRSGHEKLAQLLVEQGGDPNIDTAGYTALHAAVLTGAGDLVRTLLAHGANPNAPLTNGTPIRRSGQDLELPIDLMGATPFMLAAKFADVDILRALAGKADPRLPMKNGTTPLMAAAGFGWGGGADRRGLDYNKFTDYGNALKAQEEKDTLESVALLLDLGVDVNGSDSEGNTALFGAVAKGFNSVVQLLADKGANLNLYNKRGQTPLTLATGERNSADLKSTAELLRKLGAKD